MVVVVGLHVVVVVVAFIVVVVGLTVVDVVVVEGVVQVDPKVLLSLSVYPSDHTVLTVAVAFPVWLVVKVTVPFLGSESVKLAGDPLTIVAVTVAVEL